MTDWLKRPYAPEDYEEVAYLWIKTHSSDGVRGRRLRYALDRKKDFAEHEPAVRLLLSKSETWLIVDPADPSSVWAMACLEPDPATLHYVAVKPTALEILGWDMALEMVRDLLGPLAGKRMVAVTMEVPLLNKPEAKAAGIRGERWYTDDTYFARLLGQKERTA